MKEKSLVFIIGMIIGAIITSGVFIIINNTISSNNGIRKDRQIVNMENFNQDDMRNMKGNKESKNFENQNNQNEPPELQKGEQLPEIENIIN